MIKSPASVASPRISRRRFGGNKAPGECDCVVTVKSGRDAGSSAYSKEIARECTVQGLLESSYMLPLPLPDFTINHWTVAVLCLSLYSVDALIRKG